MNINNSPNLYRTRIDCFTQDALEQIKGTLNGDEVTFPNRGGLGTDVRYLSDFALEQIKSAVGNNGGTLEFEKVKSVWYFNEASQSEQKLDFILEDGVLVCTLNLKSVAEKDGIISFYKSENPTDESWENDLLLEVQIEGIQAYTIGRRGLVNSPNYGWISFIPSDVGFLVSFSYDGMSSYLNLNVILSTIS